MTALCACTILTVAGIARAAPDDASDAAHRALAEGRYGEAEAGYEALLRDRGYSAPILYDLGNAYRRDGKPAQALLSYERARLLDPRDPAIATNLAAARVALGVPDPRGTAERWAGSLTSSTWAWITAIGFWLTVGAGAVALLFPRRRAGLLTGAALAALGTAAAGGALYLTSQELHEGLLVASAPVLVSPFESAQSAFSLAPGDDVALGPTHDRFVYVRDARGRSGWIERVQVAPLIPTES
jgi:tetratricopeptide (TPR) repeat protein